MRYIKKEILKIIQRQYDLDPHNGWVLKPKYGAMSLPTTLKEIMFLSNFRTKYFKGDVKQYLSEIGKTGGSKSKRVLTSEQAKEMVRIREEKKTNQK